MSKGALTACKIKKKEKKNMQKRGKENSILRKRMLSFLLAAMMIFVSFVPGSFGVFADDDNYPNGAGVATSGDATPKSSDDADLVDDTSDESADSKDKTSEDDKSEATTKDETDDADKTETTSEKSDNNFNDAEDSDKSSKADIFKHLNFELYPNEDNRDVTITLDGMMPEDSSAEASDVIEEYDTYESVSEDETKSEDSASGTDASNDADNYSVVGAYDITIHDGDEEYQPDEKRPIYVVIEDPAIIDNDTTELWHIKDNGESEKIERFTVKDGRISFYATGFSVYAIVTEKDVDPLVVAHWVTVKNLNDLGSFIDTNQGLYIGRTDSTTSDNGFYFTNKLTIDADATARTGITKTKNNGKRSSLDKAIELGAVKYYFERKEGTTDQFYIYCNDDNDEKLYVSNKNNNSLLLADESEKTAFTVSINNGTVKINNDKWYWNMQGGDAGTRFSSIDKNNDANNSLTLWYYREIGNDPFHLDGKTHGLMNYAGGSEGIGLISDEGQNNAQMISIMVRSEAGAENCYLTEDTDISDWTFHNTTLTSYKISTEKDGEIKYIKINDNNSISFVSEEEATELNVTAGSGLNAGKIKLSAGNKTIYYNGTKFVAKDNASDTEKVWFNFVKSIEVSEEDYLTNTADKIGVYEAVDGQSVIVYTRIWDDVKKTYNFYAIDHDGTLYPCYERGDKIMWNDDQINTLLWTFTEYTYPDGTPNNYYELQNEYSQKYLAPQILNNQVISDNKVGIMMDGRKNHEFFSSIYAWDDTYYSNAAVLTDGTRRVKSGPKSAASDFYFAIVTKTSPDLTEVATIDNKEYGITMKIKDYPDDNTQNNKLGDSTKWEDHKDTPKEGILSTDLKENGYPKTSANVSLSELYTGATEVNNLFIESTYEQSGYFEYDSCQTFATLRKNGSLTNKFTVYQELGSTDNTLKTTLQHGQFFPFDTIVGGTYTTVNKENLYAATGEELPESDPRKYEKLIKVQSPDYKFGMEVSAGFVQTPSGKDAWGHDIVFEFTGDDDFWLYVDNELVIDLGGIHSALAGKVNFATGQVEVNGVKKTLRQVFEENYRGRNPNATDKDVRNYLSKYFDGNETIFKDYSSHTMKVFYMERGKGASNLHMRFNLSYVTPGNVLLSKKVTGSDDLDFNLVEYPYQIWYKDEEHFEEHLLNNNDGLINVTYQNSTQRVRYADSYTPPGTTNTYDCVYFLSPDMLAELNFPSDTIEYRIIECGISQDVYDHVYINDVEVKGTQLGEDTGRRSYDSGWIKVSDYPKLTYENHVDPEGLRTLKFRKKIYDERGNELHFDDDSTVYSFRLYLSNGSDGDMPLADEVAYGVRDEDGFLCRWDADQQKFIPTSYHEFSEFNKEEGDTPAQIAAKRAAKRTVTFETSMNGTISKIPPWYTVVIPNLPVGTHFKVVERFSEIPLGYGRTSYECDEGSYIPFDTNVPNSGIVRASQEPFMNVINRRGFGIEADKIWSDKNYITKHDNIYTAVYIKDGDTERLLDGTVRQITTNDTYVRYFLETMEEGKSLEDYSIYEVKLTGDLIVDPDDGVVTNYTSITRLDNLSETTISAVPKNKTKPEDFQYKVSYSKGEPEQTNERLQGPNIRRDTITNTRQNGVAITLYDMTDTDKTKVLANGEFTLKKYDSESRKYVDVDSFISDENGRVTILYEFEHEVNYKLVETKSPSGYIGLPNPVIFRVNADDTITISGNEHGDPNVLDTDKWEIAYKSEPGDNLTGYIDLYNKRYTLVVYKYDGETMGVDGALAQAHFKLYNGVKSTLGGVVKSYSPMKGYEDLVTGERGVIEGINQGLEPNTYYLNEKSPPEGYEELLGDIVFNISALGELSLISSPEGSGVTLESTPEGAEYVYKLNIPNKKDTSENVTYKITKSVAGNFGNKNKDFKFTFKVTNPPAGAEYMWYKNDDLQQKSLKSGDKFTLKHGDEVRIKLPKNTEVTITEEKENYTSTYKLNNGPQQPGNSCKNYKVAANSELAFTNTLNGIVPTGIFMKYMLLILIGGMAIGGIVFSIIRQRKVKKAGANG